jgi:hypothetical protein
MSVIGRPENLIAELLATSGTVGQPFSVSLALLQLVEEQQLVLKLFPPKLRPDLVPAPAIKYSHRHSSFRLLIRDVASKNYYVRIVTLLWRGVLHLYM